MALLFGGHVGSAIDILNFKHANLSPKVPQTIKTETSVLNKILIIPGKEIALKTIYKLQNHL